MLATADQRAWAVLRRSSYHALDAPPPPRSPFLSTASHPRRACGGNRTPWRKESFPSHPCTVRGGVSEVDGDVDVRGVRGVGGVCVVCGVRGVGGVGACGAC